MAVGSFRRLVLAFLGVLALITTAACAGGVAPGADAADPPRATVVGGVRADVGPDGASSWTMRGERAVVRVAARPVSSVYLSVTVTPPSCGAVDVSLASTRARVQATTVVSAVVGVGASGAGPVTIRSRAVGCTAGSAPRTFGTLSDVVAVLLGPADAARVEPGPGFGAPETEVGGTGWWLTRRNGELVVRGRPSSQVEVSLALQSTPCGPATVRLAGHLVQVAGGVDRRVRVQLGAAGARRLTLAVLGPPCVQEGWVGPRFVRVFRPTASRAW